MNPHRTSRAASAWAPPSLLLLLLLGGAAPQEPALPPSALAVQVDGAWRTWWRSAAAPTRWDGPIPVVADAVRWREAAPGVEWAELAISGETLLTRYDLALVRLDPGRVRFALVRPSAAGPARGRWSVADAPPEALAAFNAGQFSGLTAWGWLVMEGGEVQPPATGPLSTAVVLDGSGAALLSPASIPLARAAHPPLAFQSYPSLLVGDGEVPTQLRAPGRGVDVGHRDARLALGILPDGRLLVVLSRFAAAGDALARLPVGPTVPELAALMGALGCRRAVALDGGMSGQLLVRGADGGEQHWAGLRRVPLGLVVLPR